jgi:hypothetical protein
MARLKLLGEPEGGGTDDHSALSNLEYAQSGHSGFVPSQGVALIDILRLNQNIIQDSGGNDRIELATSSPHLTASGDLRVSGNMGVANPPAADVFLRVEPSGQNLANKILVKVQAMSSTMSSGTFRALTGTVPVSVGSGAAASLRALEFAVAVAAGSGGATADMRCMYNQLQVVAFSGTVLQMVNYWLRQPVMFGGSPSVSLVRGIYIENQGGYSAISDVESLRIEDITSNTGHKYLIEAGPSTPYLRLIGGGDPPADKSNLYLKFGSTLYRVVKSGDYMTLEAP